MTMTDAETRFLSPDQLREGVEYLDACLAELHQDADGNVRDLDTDEQKRFDDGIAERKQFVERLERHEALRQLAQLPTHRETTTPQPFNVNVKSDPFDADVRTLDTGEVRSRALRVVEESRHLASDELDKVDRLLGTRSVNCNGAQIARRLLVTERPAYRSAFQKGMTQAQPVWTAEEAEAVTEARAMEIGTDSEGGFGVPVLIDPSIILTAQGSPNDILNISRVVTITNDEWKGVSSAGATWSFDAEEAEVSDDSPTLAQPTVPVHKAQGFIPYSIEVGADYPGFASEMSMLLREGYLELVAENLTTGTGSDAPTGIVVALDANTNVEVHPATDGAFVAADIYSLWDALPIKYRNRNPSWMSSTDVQNEVRQFGTDQAHQFTVNLTQEDVPRLFGHPYFLNDFMDDFTGSTGAVPLMVVGDFSNYLVAQRAGMTVELVPHLFATNANRPSGQRGWYAWARVGADSINDLGFRLLVNE